jgi:hypothetical protein
MLSPLRYCRQKPWGILTGNEAVLDDHVVLLTTGTRSKISRLVIGSGRYDPAIVHLPPVDELDADAAVRSGFVYFAASLLLEKSNTGGFDSIPRVALVRADTRLSPGTAA